jgi:hypothetical protein
MSIKITPSAEDSVSQGYIVVAPKTSDVISDALRSAFGRQDSKSDDFTALLFQIDVADREMRHC